MELQPVFLYLFHAAITNLINIERLRLYSYQNAGARHINVYNVCNTHH